MNDKIIRKRWKQIRKKFVGRRRIHAVDSKFESLRLKGIKLIGSHDVNILSVFQLIQELSPQKYFKDSRLDFERVYLELLCNLFRKLSLGEYKQVEIIIDSRSHKGGLIGKKEFQKNILLFLSSTFPDVRCLFKMSPSYIDVLVELADFISNTFYKAYQKEEASIFETLGFKLIQIKNPL